MKNFLTIFVAIVLFISCSDATSKIKNFETEDVKINDSDILSQNELRIFSFEEEEWNFGAISDGDVVDHDFIFTNTGKAPLIISSAQGSCGCTVPKYSNEPIAPGSDGVISVQVVNDPTIENGDVTLAFECVSLSISENDPLYMRIYPNPTNGDFVTIQTPLNGVKHVDVFDITGKLLISKSLSADTLDVSSMSSGVYLVNISVNGYKETVKLIIK